MKKQIFPVAAINEVDNYPYGRLRTKAFFSVQFKKGRGFRSVFQTINPKNERVNAPKYGTYSPFEFCYEEAETGHIKWGAYRLDSFEGINKFSSFMQEHAATLQLTEEMIKELAAHMFTVMRISTGFVEAEFSQVKPLIEPTIKECTQALKSGVIDWVKISVPVDQINALPKAEPAAKYVITQTTAPVDILTMVEEPREEFKMPIPTAHPVPVQEEQEETPVTLAGQLFTTQGQLF